MIRIRDVDPWVGWHYCFSFVAALCVSIVSGATHALPSSALGLDNSRLSDL